MSGKCYQTSVVQRLKPQSKSKATVTGQDKPGVAHMKISVPPYLESKIRKFSESAGVTESLIIAKAIQRGVGIIRLGEYTQKKKHQ